MELIQHLCERDIFKLENQIKSTHFA